MPRVTTRGCYNLDTGKPLGRHVTYRLYPKKFFETLKEAPDITIIVHGFRNNDRGAVAKIVIAQDALRRLRYEHPVVGFSYDSNVRGAHIKRLERRTLKVGQQIAKANGRHLAEFVVWLKTEANCRTKIRLLGHSLGSEVIYSAIMHLTSLVPKEETKGIIEGIHLFGASLSAGIQSDQRVRDAIDHTVRHKMVNHYAPTDEVLAEADANGYVEGGPLGLYGAAPGETSSRYKQKKIAPENHRFASYAAALHSFP